MRSLRKSTGQILPLAFAFTCFTACGGGGGGMTPPPPPASVSVSPSAVSVTIPTPQTFSATVSNSANTAVNWSIQEGATGGTISVQGVYTPPSDHTGTYHILATLQADSTKSGSATATVVAPAPVISTTPSTAAAQGVGYSYVANATDPANSGIAYSLTTGPTGAILNGSTVNWTPDTSQARQSNSFSLKVTSGLGASTTQSWTVTPTGDVTTDVILNYFLESGQSSVTTTGTYAAYVPNAGGFDSVQSDSNGTFVNMPAGYFWLDEISSLVWTRASHVDMQSNAGGRLDLVYPPSQILLTYNLTGLTPTTNSDKIDYFNLNTDFSWSVFPGPPPVGSTSMSFVKPSVDPLADASKGDVSYISQRSPLSIGGGNFSVITASTGGLPLTQTGSAQTFDLTLSQLGLNSVFRANAKGSSFSALISKMGAGATDFGGEIEVDAVPYTRYGVVYPVLAKYTGTAITTDKDFGDVSYGDPFPSGWTRMVQYTDTAHVPVQVNGKNFNLSAWLYYFSKNLPTANTPISPQVEPVGSPKINNLPLTTPQTGVGLNPTISWTAPVIGRADYYWVDLVEVSAPFSTLVLSFDRSFLTKTTSITLPVGLQTGKSYILEIHAMYDPTFDVETGATTDITTLGQADFYSATFTP